MSTPFELIVNDGNLCGEGPLWDAEHQRFLWNDMNSSLVFSLDWKTGQRTTLSRGLNAAGMALNGDGSLVFAGSAGLHLWRAPDEVRTLFNAHDGETLNLNDILPDPQGRLFAGTFYWGARGPEKPGKLYRIDPDGMISVMDEGFGVANGLGFSPDGSTLYFADSTARTIYAYTHHASTGDVTGRRIFIQVPSDEGMPDGLTVDAEGFVWSAQWYGSQVVRYDPDGKVERRLTLPISQIASLAFGGPEWNELYITTAAEDWPSDYEPAGYKRTKPLGGGLYRATLDIQGKPDYIANLGGDHTA